jgi:hypothetical protein
MQTYAEFASRVSGGSGADAGAAPSGESPSPAPGHPVPVPPERGVSVAAPPGAPPLLATLDEAYDVYVNLAKSGLWFDVNPKWHSTLACFHMRCEPERAPRHRPHADPPKPRSRTVTVPVAASRAALTPARLAALATLGEEWRAELDREGRLVASRPPEREDDGADVDAENRGRGPSDGADAADTSAAPIVDTLLAMIDTDGTMAVVRVAPGLVEPDDLPPPDEDGAFGDDDDETGEPGGTGTGNQPGGGSFSDDEEDLDEADVGAVR